MDYRIVEKEAFQVVGKARVISTKDGINFKQVPEFWQDSMKDKTEEHLAPYNNRQSKESGKSGFRQPVMNMPEQRSLKFICRVI